MGNRPIFDAVNHRGTKAIQAEMSLLEIDDGVRKRLEGKGFERAYMTLADYTVLDHD